MKRIGLWPGMIFGLIGVNFAVVGVTLYAANTDASFAVEPDYDRTALAWDKVAAQERENERLGWKAAVTIDQGSTGASVQIRARDDSPVVGARVEATAFHSARASHRASASFQPAEPGVYRATLDLSRPGTWEFRITARRSDDTFTAALEASVAPPRPGDAP